MVLLDWLQLLTGRKLAVWLVVAVAGCSLVGVVW